MRASVCIAAVLALASVPNRTSAQHARAAFLTTSFGAISYTNEYSPHGYQTPKDFGYVGRVGIQVSPFGERFRFGAEYEYSHVREDWRWCDSGFGPCLPEPSELSGYTFSVQSALGHVGWWVQPYLVVGGGWLRVRDVRRQDDIGPKTDLGFGLALKPFGSDLITFAVEPRYTFFYFAKEVDVDVPSHVSLTATTRVRLVRW